VRLLVLDAYPREGRDALVGAGGTAAGALYAKLLQHLAPEACIDVIQPADPDPGLPAGNSLASYDGAIWTGSSLTIHEDADPRVRRQIELARAAYRARVPSFGSCWAAQIAVVAAGGACAANPKGREFGVARGIALSDAGRAHPMFAGKPARFDAFTSHADEVVTLPPGATLLAGNAHTRVQSVAVEHAGGSFWALQYHPEYDPHEVASLARLRQPELVDQGTFPDDASAARTIATLEALAEAPERRDLAQALELGRDLLDPSLRAVEVRNWLERCVKRR
jgi:GMP synthase (glutamine-hydrolysing)